MPLPIPLPPHLRSSTVLKMLSDDGETVVQPGGPQWPPAFPADPNRTRPHGHMEKCANTGARRVAWPPHFDTEDPNHPSNNTDPNQQFVQDPNNPYQPSQAYPEVNKMSSQMMSSFQQQHQQQHQPQMSSQGKIVQESYSSSSSKQSESYQSVSGYPKTIPITLQQQSSVESQQYRQEQSGSTVARGESQQFSQEQSSSTVSRGGERQIPIQFQSQESRSSVTEHESQVQSNQSIKTQVQAQNQAQSQEIGYQGAQYADNQHLNQSMGHQSGQQANAQYTNPPSQQFVQQIPQAQAQAQVQAQPQTQESVAQPQQQQSAPLAYQMTQQTQETVFPQAGSYGQGGHGAQMASSESDLSKEWPPKMSQEPNMTTTYPSGFKLRNEAPVQQPGQQTIASQPAFKLTKPLKMRGDSKWPPAKQGEEEDISQQEVREFIRPKNKTQDYAEFFAQNALPNCYPGYRAPPGTQHHGAEEEEGMDL